MSVSTDRSGPQHVLRELGFSTTRVGEELRGAAPIAPELHVPGSCHLRTSVLAMWADTLVGLLAARVMAPRVPVTLDLEVNLYRPTPSTGTLSGVAKTVKVGRSVFVASVEFTADDGELLAVAHSSFMTAPDPGVRLPADLRTDLPASRERLTKPLAERVGCVRRAAGTAVLPRSEDGLNASNTINGGLIALAVEEAVLSLAPGDTLCSLGLRYLQAARVGPVVATAHLRDGLGQVELRDFGNNNRLTGIATARTWRR